MNVKSATRRTWFGWLLGCGAALLIAPALADEASPPALAEIQKEVAAGQAALVDVREERETNEGYVRGAVRLPMSDLQVGQRDDKAAAELRQKLPDGKKLYVYCAAGGRAKLASEMFADWGVKTTPLKQGYKQLAAEGFPTEKP